MCVLGSPSIWINQDFTITAILERRKITCLWGCFCNWIVALKNHLYIERFSILTFHVLLTTTPILIITFIAAPPVDIDGTCESAHGSLLYGNNSISCAIVPTSVSIRFSKGLIRQWQGCRGLWLHKLKYSNCRRDLINISPKVIEWAFDWKVGW